MTMRHADVGKQQAKVVVDLGNGAVSRSRVGSRGLLLDRDRRRQPLDQVDVRLLHLLEELAGVGRQRLDVAPLPSRVDGVEGKRGLARTRQPGEDNELVAWDIDVYVFEVVTPCTAD